MQKTAYHLLPEAEPFSEFSGGAISRWAGNVLCDDESTVIVCPTSDQTWPFRNDRLLILNSLAKYHRFRRRLSQLLPWHAHKLLLRHLFAPLLKRIKRGDIVWIHNRPDFAVALQASVRRAGGKIVLYMHNSHLVEWPTSLMRRVNPDSVVFVSDFLRAQALSKFPRLKSCHVVHNGADERIFFPAPEQPAPKNPPVVLFAGRMVPDKGVHTLVAAMDILKNQGVKLKLHIVGSTNFGHARDTNYVSQLKAKAPHTVSFLPYRSGTPLGQLFREADIFCSPSQWDEPFGMVNVEAFASGLPVVSTHGGGSAEIFVHGGSILVERGSPEQLAAALRQLAEDAELRGRLGREGYTAFRDHFTWDITRQGVRKIQKDLAYD